MGIVFIPPRMCVNPLAWWKTHESQFQNVNFLTKQVFGIPRSQIETKRVFNLASVLIALRHYYLQVQTLDQIIIIINNSPYDLHLNVTQCELGRLFEG
jgi:hypothetical protein